MTEQKACAKKVLLLQDGTRTSKAFQNVVKETNDPSPLAEKLCRRIARLTAPSSALPRYGVEQ